MNTINTRLALVPAQKILNPVEQIQAIASAKKSYGFVNTREILNVFQNRGWEIESIQTNRVRLAEREGFQRHLVWLKNDSMKEISGLSKNNQTSVRLCLSNSHDLSSALNIFFGLLRVACLNQISAGNVFRHFRASHSRHIVSRLGEGIDFLSEGLPELVESLKQLQSIQMSQEQRLEYAKRLVDLRLENVKNVVKVDYARTEQALRAEDRQNDAYTTMNRIQEFCVRGGIPYSYEMHVKNDAGEVVERRLVHTHTKKLSSIPSQVKINQALMSEIFRVTGAEAVQSQAPDLAAA